METGNNTFELENFYGKDLNIHKKIRTNNCVEKKSTQSWFDNNVIDPITNLLFSVDTTKKESWFESNIFNPISKFLFGKLKNICRY